MIAVRRLAAAELEGARPLLAAEGWSLERHELARLHGLGGAVGAFEGDHLVGFLTFVDTLPYRFVGNVAVASSQRGRGLGQRIVGEAFRDAPRAALYSVEKAVTLYERLGLQKAGEIWALRADQPRPGPGGSREAEPADAAAIEALDREATRMDRSRLLRALLASYPARVVDGPSGLTGFAVAKTYADVTEIGPVVADDARTAWALVDDLLAVTPPPHDMAVHRVGLEARERGFETLFRAFPMFRGGAPGWNLDRYHAAAGLEKG